MSRSKDYFKKYAINLETVQHVDKTRWPDIIVVPSNVFRANIAEKLFNKAIKTLEITIKLSDGTFLKQVPKAPVMHLNNPKAFYQRLGNSGLIGFGESYMAKDWDATEEDLFIILETFAKKLTTLIPVSLQSFRKKALMLSPASKDNTIFNAKHNIAKHYDLSNDLFKIFLDKTLTYSSALFEDLTSSELKTIKSLEAAQINKVERLLDKLNVTKGTTLLEIGTGWGTLAMLAAKRGAFVTTLTLSKEQASLAKERLIAEEVESRVKVLLLDYREFLKQNPSQKFDAVVSVEMIEAVGEEYWTEYFNVLKSVVKPKGLIALQAITMPHKRMLLSKDTHTWILKYIFPGGQIPSIETLYMQADSRDLVMLNDLAFGQHYAKTLSIWRNNFLQSKEKVLRLGFDDTFIRMWNLYLVYSQAGFSSSYLNVHQLILKAK